MLDMLTVCEAIALRDVPKSCRTRNFNLPSALLNQSPPSHSFRVLGRTGGVGGRYPRAEPEPEGTDIPALCGGLDAKDDSYSIHP